VREHLCGHIRGTEQRDLRYHGPERSGQLQARHHGGARVTETRILESIVPKEIGTTEVRQGRTPHIVRYVLAISLTAAVVALAVVWVVMMN
jgi:hypothetical protein